MLGLVAQQGTAETSTFSATSSELRRSSIVGTNPNSQRANVLSVDFSNTTRFMVGRALQGGSTGFNGKIAAIVLTKNPTQDLLDRIDSMLLWSRGLQGNGAFATNALYRTAPPRVLV